MKNIKLNPDYNAVANLSFEEFLESLHEDENTYNEVILLVASKTYHYISKPVENFVRTTIFSHISYEGEWFDTRIIDDQDGLIIDALDAANNARKDAKTDLNGEPTDEWKNVVNRYCNDIELALHCSHEGIEKNIAPFIDYCRVCLYCGEFIYIPAYEAIMAAFEEGDVGYIYTLNEVAGCDFEDVDIPDEDG